MYGNRVVCLRIIRYVDRLSRSQLLSFKSQPLAKMRVLVLLIVAVAVDRSHAVYSNKHIDGKFKDIIESTKALLEKIDGMENASNNTREQLRHSVEKNEMLQNTQKQLLQRLKTVGVENEELKTKMNVMTQELNETRVMSSELLQRQKLLEKMYADNTKLLLHENAKYNRKVDHLVSENEGLKEKFVVLADNFKTTIDAVNTFAGIFNEVQREVRDLKRNYQTNFKQLSRSVTAKLHKYEHYMNTTIEKLSTETRSDLLKLNDQEQSKLKAEIQTKIRTMNKALDDLDGRMNLTNININKQIRSKFSQLTNHTHRQVNHEFALLKNKIFQARKVKTTLRPSESTIIPKPSTSKASTRNDSPAEQTRQQEKKVNTTKSKQTTETASTQVTATDLPKNTNTIEPKTTPLPITDATKPKTTVLPKTDKIKQKTTQLPKKTNKIKWKRTVLPKGTQKPKRTKINTQKVLEENKASIHNLRQKIQPTPIPIVTTVRHNTRIEKIKIKRPRLRKAHKSLRYARARTALDFLNYPRSIDDFVLDKGTENKVDRG